jgi:predicted DNA-binding transcriptional regulator AlpA
MFSTNEAAKKLGLAAATLSRYIILGKVPAPKVVQAGLSTVHAWTEEEIEAVRKLLPKIANGRKIRYQKLREKQKAQAGVPVPQKKTKSTKKK